MTETLQSLGTYIVQLYSLFASWPVIVRLGMLIAVIFIISFTKQLSRSSHSEIVRDLSALVAAAAGIVLLLIVLVFAAQLWQMVVSSIPHVPPTIPSKAW